MMRAKTVTVSALRTGVVVASALYNQKLVLSKIQTINEATNQMIKTTSKMLRTQGAEIQKQAIESNIDINTLKKAFADALAAFDSINEYKREALPQMKHTLDEFGVLIQQGQKIVDNIESQENANMELEKRES